MPPHGRAGAALRLCAPSIPRYSHKRLSIFAIASQLPYKALVLSDVVSPRRGPGKGVEHFAGSNGVMLPDIEYSVSCNDVTIRSGIVTACHGCWQNTSSPVCDRREPSRMGVVTAM